MKSDRGFALFLLTYGLFVVGCIFGIAFTINGIRLNEKAYREGTKASPSRAYSCWWREWEASLRRDYEQQTGLLLASLPAAEAEDGSDWKWPREVPAHKPMIWAAFSDKDMATITSTSTVIWTATSSGFYQVRIGPKDFPCEETAGCGE